MRRCVSSLSARKECARTHQKGVVQWSINCDVAKHFKDKINMDGTRSVHIYIYTERYVYTPFIAVQQRTHICSCAGARCVRKCDRGGRTTIAYIEVGVFSFGFFFPLLLYYRTSGPRDTRLCGQLELKHFARRRQNVFIMEYFCRCVEWRAPADHARQ